ncbi:hypothetical protein GGF37_005197 [Kickxella alabastrina]|nr:hypothetical protein GGF37_005197 [Kickxella alabastrina]
MALEESDNIDDILCNLWPTSKRESYGMSANPFLILPSYPAQYQQHQHQHQQPNGQYTPPEDPCGLMVSTYAQAAPLHHAWGEHPGIYALGTPSLAQKVSSGLSESRSISASIQIGDPEWRIDSPQQSVSPKQQVLVAGHGKLLMGSPVSPPPALVFWPPPPTGALQDSKPAAISLGLGHIRGQTNRSSTLGLRTGSNGGGGGQRPSAARLVTPEERVARLHTVSGLAARAVARRCLSGQMVDADALLRHQNAASFGVPLPSPQGRKPTFADVTRGSHD